MSIYWDVDFLATAPERRRPPEELPNVIIRGERIEFTLSQGPDMPGSEARAMQVFNNWNTPAELRVIDAATGQMGRPTRARPAAPFKLAYVFNYTGRKNIIIQGNARREITPAARTSTALRDDRAARLFHDLSLNLEFEVISRSDYFDRLRERGELPDRLAQSSTQGSSSATAIENARRQQARETRDRNLANSADDARVGRISSYQEEREQLGARQGHLVGITIPSAREILALTRTQHENFTQELSERIAATSAINLRPRKRQFTVRGRGGVPIPVEYPIFPVVNRINNSRVRVSWEAAVPHTIRSPNGRYTVTINHRDVQARQRDVPHSRVYSADQWLVAIIGESNLDIDLIFGTTVDTQYSRTLIKAGDLVDHELDQRLWRILQAAIDLGEIMSLFVGNLTGSVMRAIARRSATIARTAARRARRVLRTLPDNGVPIQRVPAGQRILRTARPQAAPATRVPATSQPQLTTSSATVTAPQRPPRQPRVRTPSPSDNPDFSDVTRELNLDAPRPVPPGRTTFQQRATSAVDDAVDSGFIDQHGNPLSVGAAVQPHRRASIIRTATGQTGRTRESAHIGATSLLRTLPGYSRSDAVTVLLPRATHQSFDRHWLDWIRQSRRTGSVAASLNEVLAAQRRALQQAAGLTQRQRDTLESILAREIYDFAANTPAGMQARVPLPNLR